MTINTLRRLFDNISGGVGTRDPTTGSTDNDASDLSTSAGHAASTQRSIGALCEEFWSGTVLLQNRKLTRDAAWRKLHVIASVERLARGQTPQPRMSGSQSEHQPDRGAVTPQQLVLFGRDTSRTIGHRLLQLPAANAATMPTSGDLQDAMEQERSAFERDTLAKSQ